MTQVSNTPPPPTHTYCRPLISTMCVCGDCENGPRTCGPGNLIWLNHFSSVFPWNIHTSNVHQSLINDVQTVIIPTDLMVLTNEKKCGLEVVAFDRFPFKLFTLRFSNKSVQAPSYERPKTTQRTLSLEINNCLQSVGLRHTFHIIHLTETTVLSILLDIWEYGKNRNLIINLFK